MNISRKTFYAGILVLCGVLILLHALGLLHIIERPFGRIMTRISSVVATLQTFGKNESFLVPDESEKRIQAICAKQNQENSALRSLLSLKTEKIPLPVFASVVGFNNLLGKGRMIIDKGKGDGIREGMAVIAPNRALIGTIGNVSDISSEVILLSEDASSIIASVHKDDFELLGIVHGQYQISAILDNVQNEHPLERGDIILTSSLNLMVPADIPLGTVQEVTSSQNDVFQRAIVAPLIKPDSVRFVGIVSK